MAFVDKGTGQAGVMRIDFDGATVRFYVYGGYSTTNSGGLTWSGTVNGVPVSGTTRWPQGSYGAPGILFGAWGANYGGQWVTFKLNATGTSGLGGPTELSMWVDRPWPTTVPGTPNTPSASAVTPTSMTLSWNIPGDGGLAIDQMLLRRFNPGGGYTDYVNGGNVSSLNVTGLTPNTAYQWAVYAHNGNGYSGQSGVLSQGTLPATAPGMTVTPAISGQSASVALAPPGGASGVTKYKVEYRTGGGAATAVETTSPPVTISGLTPGTTYEWRASAFFGSYESPLSTWVPVIQPNPNTNPGDYFDGATAPRGDLTFSWASTANNSVSRANGVGVDGWSLNGISRGALQRVTGGRSGSYCARMLMLRNSTGPGTMQLGTERLNLTKMAEVEPGATYVGSIYVKPSRSQRLRATLTWYTSGGGLASPATTVGQEVVVTSTTSWTRLIASGPAPGDATYAAVIVEDVSGTGQTNWLSGEWLDADDAMISLSSLFDWFSGDTPDVPAYDYAWLGAANASVSARFENVVSPIDLLADPDCPPLPLPPALPTIEADCIEEVGTWRRYTIGIPATEVRQWSSALPTLILRTGAAAERQVRIRYYANPDGLAPEMVTQDGWEAEQILTYIPALTEVTMDGVTQNVIAAVAGNAPISANRLLYGTGGVPASWPEMRCGVGYVVTMDVPLEAPAGNLEARVVVTQRM